ncbi:putative 6-carboxy-5 [Diplonema papillatum]|nr:putative 6-carboxy-5 [Diplonema papillatum]
MTTLRVRIFKQNHRFAAAHFTLYPDGAAERLHGHNYSLEATFDSTSASLDGGILAPFQVVKDSLRLVCEAWHERVLLPGLSKFVSITEAGDNYEVRLRTPLVNKFYSLPKEDVVILDIDNVSSENMAVLSLGEYLKRMPPALQAVVKQVTMTVSEGPGSEVSVQADVPPSPCVLPKQNGHQQ